MKSHRKASERQIKKNDSVDTTTNLIRTMLLIGAVFLCSCEQKLEVDETHQSQQTVGQEYDVDPLIFRKEPAPQPYLNLICDVDHPHLRHAGKYFLQLRKDPSSSDGYDEYASTLIFYETGDNRLFGHQINNIVQSDGESDISLRINDHAFHWYWFGDDKQGHYVVSRYDLNVYRREDTSFGEFPPKHQSIGVCRETSAEDFIEEMTIADNATRDFDKLKQEMKSKKLESRKI